MRHLDGHGPLQLVVVGQIDEAEAALAQHFLDPVATDPLRDVWQANLHPSGWDFPDGPASHREDLSRSRWQSFPSRNPVIVTIPLKYG